MPVSSVAVTEGSGKNLHTWQRSISSVNREEQVVLLGEPADPTYTASFDAISIATASSHVIQLMAPVGVYVRVQKIVLWQYAAASTAAVGRIHVMRLTTAGSGGTTVDPQAFDADNTAGTTAQTLPSSKGTEGVLLIPFVKVFRQAILATSTQDDGPISWQASPRGQSIILDPSTGLILKNIAAHASATVSGYIEFTETAWL